VNFVDPTGHNRQDAIDAGDAAGGFDDFDEGELIACSQYTLADGSPLPQCVLQFPELYSDTALDAFWAAMLGALIEEVELDNSPLGNSSNGSSKGSVYSNGLTSTSRSKLPKEAQDTLDLIDNGGPFPYRKDGTEFKNREGRLPAQDPGYYREYTVDTPGATDRGKRRIVVGKNGEMYYTDDHYTTFQKVE